MQCATSPHWRRVLGWGFTVPSVANALLPEDAASDEVLVALETTYHEADKLSLDAGKQYRKTLAVLAVASTGIAVSFLLYDAAELLWMILVCGALLAFARWVQLRVEKSGSHRRFIEQRALAEALRVQAYLRYAGSPLRVADLLTWTQLEQTGWICGRLDEIMGDAGPGEPHDIRGCWIESQHTYHEQAHRRSRGSVERSSRVVRAASVIGICLYVGVLVFELLCGGLLAAPVVAIPNLGAWRTVLKFAVGSVSVATLFVSSYYGKLSLERVHADHAKMARFYAWALERLDEEGQAPELLERFAREELIENGNWYSYQLEGAPDISL